VALKARRDDDDDNDPSTPINIQTLTPFILRVHVYTCVWIRWLLFERRRARIRLLSPTAFVRRPHIPPSFRSVALLLFVARTKLVFIYSRDHRLRDISIRAGSEYETFLGNYDGSNSEIFRSVERRCPTSSFYVSFSRRNSCRSFARSHLTVVITHRIDSRRFK